MQTLCIPSEINTNLLLQTGPASCHGRITMGTWPWEAPIGMQQTVLVFVLSPCTQLSDLGFEIIRLIFLKKMVTSLIQEVLKISSLRVSACGWCDLPDKDQSFSQNEWIAVCFWKENAVFGSCEGWIWVCGYMLCLFYIKNLQHFCWYLLLSFLCLIFFPSTFSVLVIPSGRQANLPGNLVPTKKGDE